MVRTLFVTAMAFLLAGLIGWQCDPARPRILQAVPGEKVQLQAAVTGASWSVDPKAGNVSPEGVFTVAPCASFVPGVYTVTARKDAFVQTFTLQVKEVVLNVEIVCAHKVGATTCQTGPLTVTPGEQVQFYARVDYSCHSEFNPRTPPGM